MCRSWQYGDETTPLNTTEVDDVWSAGYFGLYRASGGSSIQQYDDVKIGYDNNDDGDILDGGDDLQIDDDFSSSAMSLSYDNNGNLTLDTTPGAKPQGRCTTRSRLRAAASQGLTDDGLFKYAYDAWNRLVEVTRRVDAETTIATYAYLPLTRRAPPGGAKRVAFGERRSIRRVKGLPNNWRVKKVVSNCGTEFVTGDGGNTTVHFYYSQKWQILETRNGSNQATRQWVWGTQYVDEPILMDVNGDPGSDNTCDPDSDAADRRYYYHQDRNWNVVALTETDDGTGTAGRIAERYAYTPYGQFVILKGNTGSGQLGNVLMTSSTANPFGHQGLYFDAEKGSYQNRHREYMPTLRRFAGRDPLVAAPRAPSGYHDGPSLYLYESSRPVTILDPLGTCEIELVCNHAFGFDWPFFHCEWQVATSANPDNVGACHGGTTSCPDWKTWCYCLPAGCAGPKWKPVDSQQHDPQVVRVLNMPEETCDCVHDRCLDYPPTGCYAAFPEEQDDLNSNTQAKCLAERCGLPTDLPPVSGEVPGWLHRNCPSDWGYPW